MAAAWQKNNPVIGAVHQVLLVLLVSLASTNADALAETDPLEMLRLQIFNGQADKASCRAIKADPRGYSRIDPVFDETLVKLIKALKSKDPVALQPLFHPRLNMGLLPLKEALAKLDFIFAPPFDVSLYRLWALNSVDGSPSGLVCAEDQATVFPLYGYPLQFGVWLQVMGQKEIGRIFVSIVPKDNQWFLGSFHSQQWTHAGRDPQTWEVEAAKNLEQKSQLAAFLKYDLANKLLEGGKFLILQEAQATASKRDTIYTRDAFKKVVTNLIPSQGAESAASVFVPEGAGLLVRLRVPGELSLNEMKNRCQNIAKSMRETVVAKDVAGVKCSYLLPGESAEKDGALGTIYVPFNEK